MDPQPVKAPSKALRDRITDLVVGLIFVASLGVFVYSRFLRPSPPDPNHLPDLEVAALPPVVTLGGDSVAFPAAGHGVTLAYFFRTDCPACAQQKATWVEDAGRVAARGVPVYALTREEPDTLVQGYFKGTSVETIVRVPPGMVERTGVVKIPTTVLYDSTGRVLFSSVGVMDGPTHARLLALLPE